MSVPFDRRRFLHAGDDRCFHLLIVSFRSFVFFPRMGFECLSAPLAVGTGRVSSSDYSFYFFPTSFD